MIRCFRSVLSLICVSSVALAADISLPPRATNALTGSEFVRQIESLSLVAREEAILAQITAGNVPDFWRTFCPVTIANSAGAITNVATILVAPDYLAVGSDADYFLTPLSPIAAQKLADQLRCALPTPKIVSEIWRAAALKLAPAPITPSADMITVRRFAEHNSIVHTQRQARLAEHPLGRLVAGHKKDVVVASRLAQTTNRVAIFGWHKLDGTPIQPLYLGHTAAWVDYSHGIRLVRQEVNVNGLNRKLDDALADSKLAMLFSDEGPIAVSRYKSDTMSLGESNNAARMNSRSVSTGRAIGDFKPTGSFGEFATTFTLEPDARVVVNVPSLTSFVSDQKIRLILYALPNGNTIEQTIGKKLAPGDDWHFNIQHIGAQTRWLRQRLTNEIVVVAYLETTMKSWPAWRQKHGDAKTPDLIGMVKNIFPTNQLEVVLTGHSGGGSLTFGYLNAVEQIPPEVSRIAFLDSNYAYRATNHLGKLVRWLRASTNHVLTVFAYQDYLGLLDGKPFVSEAGGTWGRSLAMIQDLTPEFSFRELLLGDGLKHVATPGDQISFWLKENPERKILHTVQVAQNGFIHSQLIGAALRDNGYRYLSEPVYETLIE